MNLSPDIPDPTFCLIGVARVALAIWNHHLSRLPHGLNTDASARGIAGLAYDVVYGAGIEVREGIALPCLSRLPPVAGTSPPVHAHFSPLCPLSDSPQSPPHGRRRLARRSRRGTDPLILMVCCPTRSPLSFSRRLPRCKSHATASRVDLNRIRRPRPYSRTSSVLDSQARIVRHRGKTRMDRNGPDRNGAPGRTNFELSTRNAARLEHSPEQRTHESPRRMFTRPW